MTSLRSLPIPGILHTLDDPMDVSGDVEGCAGDEDIEIDLDFLHDQQRNGEDEHMSEEVTVQTTDVLSRDQGQKIFNDDEMTDGVGSVDVSAAATSIADDDIQDAEGLTIVTDDFEGQGRSMVTTRDDDEHVLSPVPAHVILPSNVNNDTDESTFTETSHNELYPLLTEKISPCDQNGGDTNTFDDDPCGPIVAGEYHGLEQQAPALSYMINSAPSEVLDEGFGPPDRDASTELTGLLDNASPEHFSTPVDRPSLLGKTVVDEREDDGQPVAELDHTQIHPQDASICRESEELSKENHSVHPVIIIYQDTEMSLFPPVHEQQEHSETFLLENEQSAYDNIRDLLGSCRSVLADSIDDQDELIISFEDLGLQIGESATEATTTSLNEIIAIFVQLQQNDGLEQLLPLHVNLYTVPRFTHSMRILQEALAESRGLSYIKRQDPDGNGRHATLNGEDSERVANVVQTTRDVNQRFHVDQQQSGERGPIGNPQSLAFPQEHAKKDPISDPQDVEKVQLAEGDNIDDNNNNAPSLDLLVSTNDVSASPSATKQVAEDLLQDGRRNQNTSQERDLNQYEYVNRVIEAHLEESNSQDDGLDIAVTRKTIAPDSIVDVHGGETRKETQYTPHTHAPLLTFQTERKTGPPDLDQETVHPPQRQAAGAERTVSDGQTTLEDKEYTQLVDSEHIEKDQRLGRYSCVDKTYGDDNAANSKSEAGKLACTTQAMSVKESQSVSVGKSELLTFPLTSDVNSVNGHADQESSYCKNIDLQKVNSDNAANPIIDVENERNTTPRSMQQDETGREIFDDDEITYEDDEDKHDKSSDGEFERNQASVHAKRQRSSSSADANAAISSQDVKRIRPA